MNRLWKIFIAIAILAIMILPSGLFAAAPSYRAETGFHLDWWESPNREKGLQYHIPIRLGIEYRDLEASVLSGYCYTTYDAPGEDRHSMADVLDTKLNFSYALIDRLPFDVMFGLDFNLPTGRTKLSDDDLTLVMDPDLVSITSFGEGFNVNPTISISKGWGSWLAGVGFGYIYRGEYDYGRNFQDYDPGDIYTVTGQLMYFYKGMWRFRAFANFSTYETDQLDDDNYYDEGDYFQWGLAALFYKSNYDVEFTIQNVIRGKSDFSYTTGGRISKEEDNSHGDEWIATLKAHYSPDDLTTFNLYVNYLYIDDNDYPESSIYYIGERQKITFGAGVKRNIMNLLTGEFNARGFFMHDDEAWFHPDDKQSYRGFSLELKLVASF